MAAMLQTGNVCLKTVRQHAYIYAEIQMNRDIPKLHIIVRTVHGTMTKLALVIATHQPENVKSAVSQQAVKHGRIK